MTKTTGLALLICLLLTACAHQQQEVRSNPDTNARVRVYFGAATNFYFNTTCLPKRGGTPVAAPRMLNLANTTIGMPVPRDAYRYYDEYVVRAKEPLSVSVTTGGQQRFGAITYASKLIETAWMFVPEAEADYEVIPVEEGGIQSLALRRLHVSTGAVSTSPAHFSAGAFPCE
ncbi:hypothetical protein [Ralstonia sp. ASV6]|uniref:hypothetical protein n=1 Tax=Ralstonia sp. ASV6 TaxID=2795124 RepID=UPI0018EAA210|nr:hypothetical protein [Ralstonia sp. ASV6]